MVMSSPTERVAREAGEHLSTAKVQLKQGARDYAPSTLLTSLVGSAPQGVPPGAGPAEAGGERHAPEPAAGEPGLQVAEDLFRRRQGQAAADARAAGAAHRHLQVRAPGGTASKP